MREFIKVHDFKDDTYIINNEDNIAQHYIAHCIFKIKNKYRHCHTNLVHY